MKCAHCLNQEISNWNEAAQEQDLCDDCFDELNYDQREDDLINNGWKVGEQTMEIRIFQGLTIGEVENKINEFLDRYDNQIDVISMTQSIGNDLLIISILFKVKEQF